MGVASAWALYIVSRDAGAQMYRELTEPCVWRDPRAAVRALQVVAGLGLRRPRRHDKARREKP